MGLYSDLSCNPWCNPPGAPELPEGQLHLWRVLLDVLPADESCLTPDEQIRAGKLIHAHSRHRFITMRSALRSVLSQYLQISPGSLVFTYGEHGKPALSEEQNEPDLRFNVSHSGPLGILGVASGSELGVDVETRQNVVDYMSIARRFFAPSEYAGLSEIPEPQRHRAFLRCWTRKESYIKALGQGLACSLKSFAVSVSPDMSQDALLEHSCPGAYHVSDVALPEDFCAAIAIEGRDRLRRCWTYLG